MPYSYDATYYNIQENLRQTYELKSVIIMFQIIQNHTY